MPREMYSDDSLRSSNSLDSQQYLRHAFTSKDIKRQTTKDVQRESQNLPKRKHHKTQIDYPVDQQDSDEYLHWNTTNYDWTTRTLLKKLQKIPRCHDQGTQQNSKGFAGIHKGMNPYSENEIARTELSDQSENKSPGCMGCFPRKRVQINRHKCHHNNKAFG
ncbi:uncharacterized protein LOC107268186 isoform X2 [Cephus cinctus]|uniref:Uncharacterized protein LOC107268186 isoform X2 n=1 Tax=Cephus cinctus TaxID=211228 RepID=A0AAJ7RJ40_CEPCN|nr:uncharacterized protein LOC107268186 isoform X2 [Cephus cinctus]